MDYRSILVIRFHLIGDVLLVTPALQILRRRFPNCRLVQLTDNPAGNLVKGHPAVDEVVIYNQQFGPQKFTLAAIFRHFQILRMIRREKFDLVINLQPGSRSETATELSRARTRVGYERKGMRKSCYTTALPHEWRGEYCVEEMLKPLRAIGIEAEVELPTIRLSESDRAAVCSYLAEDSRPLVVLHPGRDNTNKVWLDDRFSELARVLIERCGVRVAFVGASSECEKVDKIIAGIGQPCRSFAGKLNLREVGALIAGAKLFIGIDSSPMHIASAVGTPTIALFGPSDPKVWNPPGDNHVVVCKEPVKPHDCGEPHCSAGECLRMRNIFVEDILPAVERLLPAECRMG